jgi:uncharacterized protein (UPF0335 family)
MARNLTRNGPGHNSGGMIDADGLRKFVERINNLEADRKVIGDDIKEVYEEAKEAGFVTKIIRQIARERRLDSGVREQHLALLEAYRAALGDFAGTELGKAGEPKQKRSRKNAAQDALDKARTHLNGPSDTPDIAAERERAAANPYAAGREAALRGFNETRNPFDAGSLIGDEWLDGFKAAQSEQSA